VRRPPVSEAILEEDEEEEDFFPRPSNHVTPTTLNSSKDDNNHHIPPMRPTTIDTSKADSNHHSSSHVKSSFLPSLDDLPQPFGRLELDGPSDRMPFMVGGQSSSGSQQRRSLSSRLSSEKDHRERDEEDLGFARPGQFARRGGGERSWEDEEDGGGPAGDLESLEKYRPHNYEFSKPKSEDINDLVDFYSSYRAPGRGRPSGSSGVYRQRSLDSDEGAGAFHLSEEESAPPRKKYSDPGRYDGGGGGGYQNGGSRQTVTGIDPNGGGRGRRNAPDENGFYDLDTIDPATRLILERARQTRSRPIESFGASSFLRNGSPGLEDDFRSLRPPPGRVVLFQPCSDRNMFGSESIIRPLTFRIILQYE
jgi:hypothetical protein